MRVRVVSLVLLLLTFGACTKKTEAELREDDRAKIDLVVAEDVKASKAMAEADDASRNGDLPGALDAIDKRAAPAIEAGLRATATTQPQTDWGRAKRALLAQILEDRRKELGPYAAALKAKDPEQLVEAMEAQAKIERRAIAAVAEVRAGR